MKVGEVAEAWIYPVKSMAGQQVPDLDLDLLGVIGDRSWALLDTEEGDIAWGKRFPKVMDLAARYVGERPAERVFGDAVPAVSISLPDGREVTSNEAVDATVSEFVGAPLTLSPLQSPENKQHYEWSEAPDEASILRILGIGPGEDPPDFSGYDEDLMASKAKYFSAPGTYTDMAPLHVLTTASIRHMEGLSGEEFDLRRFRPNLLIDTVAGVDGLAEFTWVGKTLRVGAATLKVEAKSIRCSMPARPQAPHQLPPNPQMAKALYNETRRFLGAYLSVVEAGPINVGAAVELID